MRLTLVTCQTSVAPSLTRTLILCMSMYWLLMANKSLIAARRRSRLPGPFAVRAA